MSAVRIFLAARGIRIEVPGLGPLTVDVAYGGNFYAIIEPQIGYHGIDDLGAARILALSPVPCGTGTSARLAHLAGTGRLREGEPCIHESIIGSRCIGRVQQTLDLQGTPAIIPFIEGSAFATGFNTSWIDPAHLFPTGFQVIQGQGRTNL